MKPWGWLDGWGVVLLAGFVAAALASVDSDGAGVWWLLSHGAAFVWGLPYVAAGLTWLAALAVAIGLAVGAIRTWRRSGW